jgi:choline dehydrogenase
MHWDYIVIGAGSSGCAVAHHLVKAGRTVLVLEAGGAGRSPFLRIPAAIWHMPSRFDWGYRAEPDFSRGGVVEAWRRGRVLGGTSCINGMVYVRGALGDFDRWSDQCQQQGGWSASDVGPIFRDIEHSDQNGPSRGQGGPLYVRTVRRPHALTDAFIESTSAAGFPFNADYNGATQEGVGYMQFTQRRGLRWNAADAFLKPHLGKPNLKLLLNTTVEKIEFAGTRASAVIFRRGGSSHRETARHIILSAGAINSPKLLMLSGIGDREELQRHGIETRLELPGVGRQLKEHPFAQINYRVRVASYNLTEGLLQKLAIGAKYLAYREGPLAAVYEAGAFLKLFPSSSVPDVQVFFAPIGWTGEIGEEGEEGALKLAPYPAVKVVVVRSHSRSHGRVRLRSRDPDAPPIIELRLFDDESDIDVLVRGIEQVRAIMQKKPMAAFVEEEIDPGAARQGPGELGEYVRKHSELACHAMGTCRMGLDADAVVAPDMRVRGLENVWVADASIMPDAISANLNAPCMLIGAKLGKQLAAMA